MNKVKYTAEELREARERKGGIGRPLSIPLLLTVCT